MVRREDIGIRWTRDAAMGTHRCDASLSLVWSTEAHNEMLEQEGAREWAEENLRLGILRRIFGVLEEPLARLEQAAPVAFGPQINPTARDEYAAALGDIRRVMGGREPLGRG